jgi:hypothetical protein
MFDMVLQSSRKWLILSSRFQLTGYGENSGKGTYI